MPAFIPLALTIGGVAAGGFATVLGASLLVGSIAASVIMGGIAARKAKNQARDSYNAAQVDRLANVVTTVGPRELVLGRVRKGGSVAFRGSAGYYKESFIVHLALAAHEIDAVEQIYLNDIPVTLDGNGYVTTAPYGRYGTTSPAPSLIPAGSLGVVLPQSPLASSLVAATSGNPEGLASEQVPYTLAGSTVTLTQTYPVDVYVSYQVQTFKSYARIWWDLGAPGVVADARTKALFPDLWTDAHRGQGVARILAEFEFDETAFPSGLPSMTAVIRGAKVYDPRSGSTAWSDNPALLARHVYQHPQFGKATVSAAEDARFTAAANACDLTQNYVVGGVADAQKLYRASLVAQFGSPAKGVLDDLTQAMAGIWAFAGGELYIRAGTYTAPVLALTDADLAVIQREGEAEQQDAVAISVHREQAAKFNTVNLRIWDAAQGYKEVGLTPLVGAALKARDGGKSLAQEVQLAAVNYAPQALHIAGVMMRDARDPLTVVLPFKLKAWPVELLDTVSLTLSRYGWSSKPFMVVKREWDRARGVVRLTLKETSASIFTPDAAFLPQGGAPNTSLPRPWDIAPPAITAGGIFSGTGELLVQADGPLITRVRVTWPAQADASIARTGFTDIEWKPVAGSVWQRVTVTGDSTAAYLVGAIDGQAIVVRGRNRNTVATSDWSVQVLHAVVGKTEPPPDVKAFTIDGDRLSWPGVSAADLAGYQIRFAYGNNTFWASATPVHEGLITDSPYTLATRPVGVVTLLVKAVDTSGNESTNAASVVTNLGDPDVNNILLSFPEAPTFTGTITNGAVSGGVLQATGLDRFYGDDAQPFYGPDGELRYPAGTYAQLQYAWSEVLPYAGTVLLEHMVVASDFGIEYQRDSQEARYGSNADPFYGPDPEPFYGPPGAWQVWPGSIELTAAETVSWRITAAAGATQGQVSVATVILDVPDVVEELQDVVISAGGTRLPITQQYRAIKNVLITLQTDGNGGRSVTTEDKNAALGPLITVRNAAGVAVAGLVDARIKGY